MIVRGTVAELDTAIPSTRWIQRCIRDRTQVNITTMSGTALQGTIRWQDTEFVCLVCDSKEVLVLRLAIAIMSPV